MRADKRRLEFLKQDAVQGFTELIGLKPVSMKPGRFVTRIKMSRRLAQQDGFAHAGLLATMVDHTAGYAAFTLAPEDHRILTVEYKINYLKPVSGEFIECRANVLKPGRQIMVCEAEIFSITGRKKLLCAKAILTMASVPGDRVKGPKMHLRSLETRV
jgi:uncharacterized protein (TIGR00369 family)